MENLLFDGLFGSKRGAREVYLRAASIRLWSTDATRGKLTCVHWLQLLPMVGDIQIDGENHMETALMPHERWVPEPGGAKVAWQW